ncbi:hypothetical protein [Kingella sp. (in: b-proteobacteria)]|nr:hypothetical protein [Kingella sp. (in: b-proteobacteria)]MDO4657160.1 hypothetical protein [Kingella sp. (in: b-proteobacteria)]
MGGNEWASSAGLVFQAAFAGAQRGICLTCVALSLNAKGSLKTGETCEQG